MKIIIATGIFPPDIGGPANYAKNLAKEFLVLNHEITVVAYADTELKSKNFEGNDLKRKNYKIITISRTLPTGIRHIVYFFKIVLNLKTAQFILVLDTFSAGLPAVLAAKIFRKKIILRTGGDFLWEQYVERTGKLVLLRDFYERRARLSLKEKIIFTLTKFVLKKSDILVFSTEWQKRIFSETYDLRNKKITVIENFYGSKIESEEPKEKNIICACRNIKLKNLTLLKKAFDEAATVNKELRLEIFTEADYDNLIERVKKCYFVIMVSLSEISPNFILDAIRLNKPFILTRETGLYEKLKDAGVFVDPLNKEDIRNKILFLADDENYGKFKNKASNFNFTHSWREIANEFIKKCESIRNQ